MPIADREPALWKGPPHPGYAVGPPSASASTLVAIPAPIRVVTSISKAVVSRFLFAGVCFIVYPSGLFFSFPLPSRAAMLSSLSVLRRAAPSLRRAASSSPTAYTYTRHGHPSTVMTPSTAPAAAAPSGDQVAVSFLAAGVDAGDVAAVLGVDGAAGKAPFPRVGGHGGVALVTKVGGSVKGLKEGDYVVPAKVRLCHSGGGEVLAASAKHVWLVLAVGSVIYEVATVWIAWEPLVRTLSASATSRTFYCSRGSWY